MAGLIAVLPARVLGLVLIVAALGPRLIAAAPPKDEIVKMDEVRVPAGGRQEFVPHWSFDVKPFRLLLRNAERVRSAKPLSRWLMPVELEIKDGDEIVSANGKRSADAGFITFWQSLQKDGTALTLELRSVGASRTRKVDYVLRLKTPEPATAPKKKGR